MNDNEFYPTPPDICVDLVLHLVETLQINSPFERVLEPSAGSGNFTEPLSDICSGDLVTVEPCPRPGFEPTHVTTFEEYTASTKDRFNLICGNSPFSLAEAHVRAGLGLLRRAGFLAFLLRLSFLASASRAPFFKEFPPYHVTVLGRRPTFIWSWHCKYLTCNHSWKDEVGKHYKMCPNCGSTAISKNTSDVHDYGFFIWLEDWKGKPRLDWLL